MLPPRPEDTDFGNGAPAIASDGNGTGGELVPLRQELPYLPAPSWPVGPSRPEILTAGPDPISLLYALRRRWFLASVAGLVSAAVLAVAALWLWPKSYDVVALLHFSRESASMLPNWRSRTTPQAYESNLRTQVGLIKSDFVLISAFRDPAISQLPIVQAETDKVAWLKEELVVVNPRQSELLQISMQGENSDQLVKIIDAVIAKYFTEHVDKERKRKLAQLTRLEDIAVEKEEGLRQRNNRLLGLLEQIGPGAENWQSVARLNENELRNLQQSERVLNAELVKTNAKIKQLLLTQKFVVETGMSEYALEAELRKDEEYLDLLSKAHELRDKISDLELAYKHPENKPSWQTAQGKLRDLQDRLDGRRFLLEPMIRDAVDGADQIADELRVEEESKESMEVDLEIIAGQIDEVKAVLKNIGRTSPEIKAVGVNIEALEKSLAEIAPLIDSLKFELDSPPPVELVQGATPPESSNWLQRALMVSFSGLAGFLLAVFGVAVWEFQSRRVNSSEQIAEGLGLRLVGTLPALSARQGLLPGGRNRHDTLKGVLTESIDSVRAALIHSANGAPHQVILVTSAMDQEGKTTVASQLAVSLARSGRRTLLVDADLRNPAGHRLFELSLEDGLGEVLRGQVDLDDVIRPTRAPGLWMISAGRCDLESLQELAKGTLQGIFDRIKPQFEFVVVDSAPVLTVADTLVVGQAADSVVLSVLRDVSRMPKVYEASERLESVGIRILGVVVNGASITSHRRMYELSASA